MIKIAKQFVIIILLVTSTAVYSQKHKFLEGKKYATQFYEIKPSGRSKAMPSEFYFKAGKMYADIMEEKIMYPPVNYKVILDSVYTEDGDQIQMIVAEVIYEEDNSTYKAEFTITNFAIEGTFKVLKGTVEKKKFEFDGEEKRKK